MSLTVLPTNIGGTNLKSITGPLASLLAPTGVQYLAYPSDLGSNPSMNHAVLISAYDYSSGLSSAVQNLINGGSITPEALSVIQASKYNRQTQGAPLVNISLFMPETVNVTYNSDYQTVNVTEELGIAGFVGSAATDINKENWKNAGVPYTTVATTTAAAALGNRIGLTGQNLGSLATQAFGIFTNPQMQLIYRGIALREFQLEFILTPKTSNEAATVKNICDSLAFYSLPGVAGAQVGNSGQFLTPPQIFKVQFQFLGANGIAGALGNALTSAMNNIGLGFLSNTNNPLGVDGNGVITNGNPAKVMTINDCVLENVNIDYAPNGWAAYNDGYPVQTRLTLQFKETQMITKNQFRGSQIADNYAAGQATNAFNDTSNPNSQNFIGV